VLAWRAPALGALLAVALAVLARIPFLGAPLTADEGGYAEVARLWERSHALYAQTWVDRPQGLVLIYRGISDLGLGSTQGFRAAAAAVAVLTVLATTLVALRLGGRIPASAAALLLATAGSSPFIESFTLSGELLATLPAALSLLAFVSYARRGGTERLVAAGLLTGCAFMVKQSALDAGMAAIAYLVWTRGRRGLRPAAILTTAAAVPLALGALSASSLGDWWYAVFAYRGQGDSLVTGSVAWRLHLLWLSLPAASKALGLVALLAAVGWRRSPLLARLWFGAAAVGVLGGGNFHTHYYIQLAPPLAVLAGFGVAALWESAGQVAWAACGGTAAASLAIAAPLWFVSGPAQARAIWPQDPHLVHDATVARYVRGHTRPTQSVYVLWAAADLYYLADRTPSFHYLWYRNVQAIPGALPKAEAMIAARRPALIVAAQAPSSIDPTGQAGRILRAEYRRTDTVAGMPIYVRRAHRVPAREVRGPLP
jgi:4-amino-4-deoxy-L-arabinose transferase-like glycosyltransferase